MRCYVRVQVGKSGLVETACYEILNDRGECPIHGQQAVVKPEWMGEEQWRGFLERMKTNKGLTKVVDGGIGTSTK